LSFCHWDKNGDHGDQLKPNYLEKPAASH